MCKPSERSGPGFLPWILALALLGLGATPGASQYFGQNKVQYQHLDWAVLKTAHFHIYFHEGEREVAVDAGRMAERAYDRLSTILDHQIKEPVPVILYASQTEFQQSNVTPELIGEGTGGFTEFVKRRVTLPITGSYRDFDHVLTHELVHAFQADILSGGGENSISGALRYMPPLWFMEGMAEYLSLGEIDPQTEMWLRDGALKGYLTPLEILNQVQDIRVYRYGQAVLAYLGATYGDQTIGEILKKLSHARSLSKAFEQTVGLTLEKFSEDWTEAVRREDLPTIRDHQKPEAFAFRLTKADRDLSNMNLTPAVSPDGSRLVYFSDRSLYNDLYLASALDGRIQRRLVKGERKADFESLRFYTSSMDWSPEGDRIVFVALAGGKDALYIMRVRDGRVIRRIRTGLDGMVSPSWSPDGNWIAFSGLRGGRSELYRVHPDGTGLEQLTEGRFLAQEPRYSPDGRQIVFVSDRGPGTDFENLIFSLPQVAILDLETRGVTVLPRQSGRNISPHFLPDGRHLVFISDRTGIANLFIRDLDSGEDRRVSDILTGVAGVTPTSPALSLSRNGKRLVFSAFTEGTWDLYAIKDPLDLWARGERWNGPFPSEESSAGLPPPDEPAELGFVGEKPGPLDSLLVSPAADSAGMASADGTGLPLTELGAPPAPAPIEARPDSAAAAMGGPEGAGADSLMRQIRGLEPPEEAHYEARRLPHAGPEMSDSTEKPVDVARVLAEKRALPDPATFEIDRYRPRFTADYVSANGFFASNVGLAAQSVLQFSDILGDQIILVGANIYGSISDSDLLFEYVNLRRRISWGVSAFQFRNDYYIYAAQANDQFVSQIYRGVNLTLQRPFNRFRRIEWSLQALGVSEEVYQESFDTGYSTAYLTGKGTYTYLAPGLALVSDNTIYGSTGPIGGGRDRIGADVGVGDLSFRSYVLDFRRYLNLRHRYALAWRAIGAMSEGRDPQFFRIGGPYTLRGYPFGEFRGTKIGLSNLEFRFPLIEQLRLGFPLPLSLQGVRGAIFFDAGAAWDETSRFRAFNSGGGGRRLQDIRASYGLSTSMNIGFAVLKWDLAWPTDLQQNLGPARGYLSLGLDF